MSVFRTHRRFTAALTLLVMLLSVLLPTVAQAVVRASGQAHWVQVCSTSGMVWVNAVNSAEPSEHAPSPAGPLGDWSQQCPWCALHGGAAGLPTQDWALAGFTAATEGLPAWGSTAPVSAIWAVAHARAPPTLA